MLNDNIYLWNDNLSRTCPKILSFNYKITASFHLIEKKKKKLCIPISLNL